MTKVRLTAGANVDILSGEEHAKHVAELYEKLTRYLGDSQGTFDVQAAPGVATNASGNATVVAYNVPAGFHAFMVRLVVDYEGSTDKTPTSCDVHVYADDTTPAATRALAAQVPTVFSDSPKHAPLFRQGQRVLVAVTGGPATTTIYTVAQVLLVPTWALRTGDPMARHSGQ